MSVLLIPLFPPCSPACVSDSVATFCFSPPSEDAQQICILFVGSPFFPHLFFNFRKLCLLLCFFLLKKTRPSDDFSFPFSLHDTTPLPFSSYTPIVFHTAPLPILRFWRYELPRRFFSFTLRLGKFFDPLLSDFFSPLPPKSGPSGADLPGASCVVFFNPFFCFHCASAFRLFFSPIPGTVLFEGYNIDWLLFSYILPGSLSPPSMRVHGTEVSFSAFFPQDFFGALFPGPPSHAGSVSHRFSIFFLT